MATEHTIEMTRIENIVIGWMDQTWTQLFVNYVSIWDNYVEIEESND